MLLLLDLLEDRLARRGGQQVDVGVGRVQQVLAGDAGQLRLLLPDLALGVDALVHGFAHVHGHLDAHARPHRAHRGQELAVLVEDAPLVAVVSRADVDIRDPRQVGDLLLQLALVELLATGPPGRSGPQPEDGVQRDGQHPPGRLRGHRQRVVGPLPLAGLGGRVELGAGFLPLADPDADVRGECDVVLRAAGGEEGGRDREGGEPGEEAQAEKIHRRTPYGTVIRRERSLPIGSAGQRETFWVRCEKH